MVSLVAQLQADALDRAVPVSDLLRKAKVVAVKLRLDEFRRWVEDELDGYGDKEAPAYRAATGEPKGFNPYRGWVPLIFQDSAEHQKAISTRTIGQSIGALEYLASREGRLSIPYSPDINDLLNRTGDGPPTQFALFIDRAVIVGILDAVRNAVLDWALKLEDAGIVGDEMQFTPQEKAKAHEPNIVYQINTIENFVGAMGPVSGQATVTATQSTGVPVEAIRELCGQMKKFAPMIDLSAEARASLDHDVAELEAELAKAEPEQSRVKRFLRSLKSVVEGAAGNVIADGILHGLSKLPFSF